MLVVLRLSYYIGKVIIFSALEIHCTLVFISSSFISRFSCHSTPHILYLFILLREAPQSNINKYCFSVLKLVYVYQYTAAAISSSIVKVPTVILPQLVMSLGEQNVLIF